MFLIALVAAPLLLAPDLPVVVPDNSTWEVVVDETFQRRDYEDIVNLGSRTMNFVQSRGICPRESGDCLYTVRHEYRHVKVGGQMVAFTHRFKLVGPTGATTEGLRYFSMPYGRPNMDMFFRAGPVWIREYEIPELYRPAWDYYQMLLTRHRNEPPPGF